MSTPKTSPVAERMSRLGTETAFAVSAEANAWRALGHTVYPFHLGDMDLRTPENVVEAAFRAIRDGKTGYCPNAGIPELREALAADVGASRGVDVRAAARRRAAGRQARHREVPAHAHGPRRRGPLPQPRLPDLREPDRVPRRRRQALRLRARGGELPARLRRDRGRHHPADQAPHLQQPPQPHGSREPGRGDPGARRPRPRARPVRAVGRGVLGRAVLRPEQVDRRRCPACRSGRSSCTRSARSTP